MDVIFRELKLPKKDMGAIRNEFYERMIKSIKKNGTRTCSSIDPLRELKKEYDLVIVSNSEMRLIDISMKKLGIRKLFKEVCSAEMFSVKNVELKKLFRKYGMKSRESIFVGDRFSDAVFAKKAGCISVIVHNRCSWSTLEEVLQVRPNFIVKDFEELAKVVKKIYR